MAGNHAGGVAALMAVDDTTRAWRRFRLAAPVRGLGKLASGILAVVGVFDGSSGGDPDKPEACRREDAGLICAALVPSVLAGSNRERQPDLMRSMRVRALGPAVTVKGHLDVDEDGYRWLPRGEAERGLAREFAGSWADVDRVTVEAVMPATWRSFLRGLHPIHGGWPARCDV